VLVRLAERGDGGFRQRQRVGVRLGDGFADGPPDGRDLYLSRWRPCTSTVRCRKTRSRMNMGS